ncbi:hypothetical protein PoB_003977200 [Plakobranchus ocellatus]|uniref:Uncharacterized protein n=1 Tax=Plakobranchus ocellatus TaxID=259542 RepID=A0AAV4B158_9GAST|nr:hypothetical protein PoB_003977200 [Plakobranchus ocellatus]
MTEAQPFATASGTIATTIIGKSQVQRKKSEDTVYTILFTSIMIHFTPKNLKYEKINSINNSERPLAAAPSGRRKDTDDRAAAHYMKEKGQREKTPSRCGKKIRTQRVKM